MVRHPFSTSPSYLESIRGLHRLHALALEGRNDSPEADAIRDGLERPWYDLSAIEQERIEGLSEDLYSISDPPQEPLTSNPQVQRKLAELDEARQSGKWDEALELLRRWCRYIDPALLSSRRGSLWREAGDDETAALFFEHASRLQPTNGGHKSLYLSSIKKFNPDLASKLAREIVENDETNPPELVVIAAGIVLESDEKRGEIPLSSPERLIPTVERTLGRLQAQGPNHSTPLKAVYVMATLLLGRCHALTGDSRAAIRSLDLSIAVDPFGWDLLLYRGVLRYGVEPGAIDDFERAIELGSGVVWPHFYLAHHALNANRFEDCLEMCGRALTFLAPDEVQAIIHEWSAISRTELGYPADQVRSAFEEAMRLAPDADRIRENLAAFEAALANPTGPRPEWIKPRASTVQAFGRSEFRPSRPSPLIAA